MHCSCARILLARQSIVDLADRNHKHLATVFSRRRSGVLAGRAEEVPRAARIRPGRRMIDVLGTPLYCCQAMEPNVRCMVRLATANPVRRFDARGTAVVASQLTGTGARAVVVEDGLDIETCEGSATIGLELGRRPPVARCRPDRSPWRSDGHQGGSRAEDSGVRRRGDLRSTGGRTGHPVSPSTGAARCSGSMSATAGAPVRVVRQPARSDPLAVGDGFTMSDRKRSRPATYDRSLANTCPSSPSCRSLARVTAGQRRW